MPYLISLAALVVFWILYWLITGKADPLRLAEGHDERLSTSKFQWFVWTVAVVFSYVAIFVARVQRGVIAPIEEVPTNLLIAMGLSTGTMAVAKGVTSAYVASGVIKKPKKSEPEAPPVKQPYLAELIADDTGFPDLSKVQMLTWTAIAIAIFIFRVVRTINNAAVERLVLPDIEPSLMVLMGIGQVAYLGKKLVTTYTPRITGLSPGAGKAGTKITITGEALGEKQDGNLILINGSPIAQPATTWEPTKVEFKVPTGYPAGKLDIGLIVSGRETNTLPFTFEVGE